MNAAAKIGRPAGSLSGRPAPMQLPALLLKHAGPNLHYDAVRNTVAKHRNVTVPEAATLIRSTQRIMIAPSGYVSIMTIPSAFGFYRVELRKEIADEVNGLVSGTTPTDRAAAGFSQPLSHLLHRLTYLERKSPVRKVEDETMRSILLLGDFTGGSQSVANSPAEAAYIQGGAFSELFLHMVSAPTRLSFLEAVLGWRMKFYLTFGELRDAFLTFAFPREARRASLSSGYASNNKPTVPKFSHFSAERASLAAAGTRRSERTGEYAQDPEVLFLGESIVLGGSEGWMLDYFWSPLRESGLSSVGIPVKEAASVLGWTAEYGEDAAATLLRRYVHMFPEFFRPE